MTWSRKTIGTKNAQLQQSSVTSNKRRIRRKLMNEKSIFFSDRSYFIAVSYNNMVFGLYERIRSDTFSSLRAFLVSCQPFDTVESRFVRLLLQNKGIEANTLIILFLEKIRRLYSDILGFIQGSKCCRKCKRFKPMIFWIS